MPVQRLAISLCIAHTVNLCLLLKAVVLHRSGPVHRVTKRPHQSAQLARAARFASERSVFSAFFSFFFLRKSEVALPSQTAFDDRRLSRASVLWLIHGTLYNDPSAAQLCPLVPGRDFMLIKPPRSKADQDGTNFGALLI